MNNVSPAFVEFARTMHTLLIARAAVSIASALAGRPATSLAFVGNAAALSLCEALMDFGLRELNFFEGDREDRFHPSRPLDELRPDCADLIFIGDRDPAQARCIAEACGRAFSDRCGPVVVEIDRLGKVQAELLQDVGRPLETCLNPHKLALLTVALYLAPPGGCVVEAGVDRGGTTVFLAKLQSLLGIERPIYALDTFDGMPEPVTEDYGGGFVYTSDMFRYNSIERVARSYEERGVESMIRIRQGLVQETLPQVLAESPALSFMLLDTDQYSGTKGGLACGLPALLPGGLIIVDDTTVHGVETAIREQMDNTPSLRRVRLSQNFDLLWMR